MSRRGFRLQPVLRHRELLEDRARQRLATAVQVENELRLALEKGQADLHRLQQELEMRRCHGISVQDLLLFEENIAHRGRLLTALEQDLERARREVEESRQALIRSSQDRRVLEKLKEKREAEARQEATRRETRVLDEIAVQFDRERI